MTQRKGLLLGCGILKNEVTSLINKNAWPLDTIFLDSALHCEFDKLSHGLTTELANQAGMETLVFYGACHPLMDRILEEHKTIRTDGQNCIEMLLGKKLFTDELLQGAFFLLEDWALRWRQFCPKSFGTNKWDIIREMIRGDRTSLLCLRTPCSGDFTKEAEEAGALMDLPVRWMDVGLDHLEEVLKEAIFRQQRGSHA